MELEYLKPVTDASKEPDPGKTVADLELEEEKAVEIWYKTFHTWNACTIRRSVSPDTAPDKRTHIYAHHRRCHGLSGLVDTRNANDPDASPRAKQRSMIIESVSAPPAV